MAKLQVLALALLALVSLGYGQKTKLSVYYETLCPDSRRFITTQLYPFMKSPVGQHLEVELVPYGKATTSEDGDGAYDFDCQHGPRECAGNRVHSCAVKHLKSSEALEFVQCSMASRMPEKSGQHCATQMNLDFSAIEKCLDSGEGDKLLAANGKKTHGLSPRLYFVPWIVFDGVWSREKMEASLGDLRTAVCDHIGQDKCADTRGSRRAKRRSISTFSRLRRA